MSQNETLLFSTWSFPVFLFENYRAHGQVPEDAQPLPLFSNQAVTMEVFRYASSLAILGASDRVPLL